MDYTKKDCINTIDDLKEYYARSDNKFLGINFSPVYMGDTIGSLPGFHHLCPVDVTDATFSNVIVPKDDHGERPLYLGPFLERQQVIESIRKHGPFYAAGSLFYGKDAEMTLNKLGLKLFFPETAIREKVGSKCGGHRIALEAGVEPVQAVLSPVKSWKHVRKLADDAELGEEFVVQGNHGDSGLTTCMLRTEEDYRKYAWMIESSDECRIMRKLRNPQSVTVEAVLSRAVGVGQVTEEWELVGPVGLDNVGLPQLTTNQNAWIGNVVGLDVLPAELERQIRVDTKSICKALRKHGYWGSVCLDFLLEEINGKTTAYFQEINARFSGFTPLTTVASARAIGFPLFGFHFAAFEGLDLRMKWDFLHRKMTTKIGRGRWSSLVIKQIEPEPNRLTRVPRCGIYRIYFDQVKFVRASCDFSTCEKGEFFLAREARLGDVLHQNEVMARLYFNGVATEDRHLTESAERMVAAVRAAFELRDFTIVD